MGDIVCSGEYGVFEGSSADQVVMHEYRTLGSWAKDVVTLMVDRLFAEQPGTLIDVGANLGLVVIPVVERSGALGIAFEPEPRNFAYLERNVARHGLSSRIELHPVACYSERARLPLLLSETNLGDHRLQRAADGGGGRVVEVAAERLDDVLRGRDLPRPIVLKIDAQGSEVCIFEGAHETLARADFVITEYCPELIVAHGETAQRFEQIMRGFDFGAVLHVLPLPEPLNSSEHVFSQLSWIENDGSDPGFFDLLFSRHWVLPNHPPEMNALVAAIAREKAERAGV
jgi:FkbM family methyltransferase